MSKHESASSEAGAAARARLLGEQAKKLGRGKVTSRQQAIASGLSEARREAERQKKATEAEKRTGGRKQGITILRGRKVVGAEAVLVRSARAASPLDEAIFRTIRSTAGMREAAADFTTAYRADPMERVELVKRGVPADFIQALAKRMSMSKERLAGTLGLASATVNRKSRSNKPLSRDESSRVLGMARLVGQIQAMVEESGSPDGFDAATWVAQWLEKPLPALDGRRPAELMDTPEGQRLVSDLAARLQTGAYA